MALTALALVGFVIAWAMLQRGRSEEAPTDLPPATAAVAGLPEPEAAASASPPAPRQAAPEPPAASAPRSAPPAQAKAAPGRVAPRSPAPAIPAPQGVATEPAPSQTAPARESAPQSADTPPVATAPATRPERAAAPAATAYLDVRVRSLLREGTLTLLVDGREVYSVDLATETGRWARIKKRAAQRAVHDLETRLGLGAGAHTIEARAVDGASRQLEERAEIVLEAGQTRRMVVVAGGTFGDRLSFSFD
jgi:hypothetical protein